MPRALFDGIYHDLRSKVESGLYAYQSFLPSESDLVGVYGCSRNTIRRALRMLSDEGFVQPLHGKGVRVIWRTSPRDVIGSLDGLQSFAEYAHHNRMEPTTVVRTFEHVTCDETLARYSGFAVGTRLIHMVRTRSLDGFPCQVDRDYLLEEVAEGLTREIAESSTYRYLEEIRGMRILTSRRQVTVELASEEDRRYLRLDPYNCVAVIESHTFNSDGLMFEFSRVENHPDTFRYCAISKR
ncbi:GntR family trehalose operon transcriptional repressor [Olsenella profusa DSM 13989]|uniref:UbiC transcription regulator-associated domain protein n=1 Tax=Olsenella profusa F0195 TaxID=1125712 RepID=U2TBZ0_9ACTN|nr:UTRA domain-containing protein [Olsenella profusa]ERL10569.1 UbiC transcription regulator-associated domain protein [Olsenella profusa F0195]MDP9858835.1 GntR family trehalose operon transcriptional repressor [Olsenella profusa DSM 13989]